MSGMLANLFNASPANAKLALEKLRTDPERAAAELTFIVDAKLRRGALGGSCSTECRRVGINSYALCPTGDPGKDYFFPYTHATQDDHGRVGFCRVPRGRPNGTIVLTGGMNGCSLEVRRLENGDLTFLHDADGRSMASLSKDDGRLGGKQVCRVDWAQYGRPYAQENSVRTESGKSSAAMPVNFLITVKAGGSWKVLHSAVLLITTLEGRNKLDKYQRLPTLASLVTSFEA